MFLLFLPCILAISLALESPYYNIDQAESLFEDFIVAYNKIYPSVEEKQMRFKLFKDALKNINEQNSNGGTVFAINQFSDLTIQELNNLFSYRRVKHVDDYDCMNVTDADIITNNAPDSLNWVEKGAVTAVKDQKLCSSCYAFVFTGNIEGQYFLKNNKLLNFSEQEIVDCSIQNFGCEGGSMITAILDLKNLGGALTETTYPYKGREQECQFDHSKIIAKIKGCKNYQLKDEDKLKEVLAKQGPISALVSGFELKAYTKGIWPKTHCSGLVKDHAVLLVGYGTDQNGTAYWLIKSSWGPKWGEKGYARITRGENTCGIMDEVVSVEL